MEFYNSKAEQTSECKYRAMAPKLHKTITNARIKVQNKFESNKLAPFTNTSETFIHKNQDEQPVK